jgi:hypothetical protein
VKRYTVLCNGTKIGTVWLAATRAPDGRLGPLPAFGHLRRLRERARAARTARATLRAATREEQKRERAAIRTWRGLAFTLVDEAGDVVPARVVRVTYREPPRVQVRW